MIKHVQSYTNFAGEKKSIELRFNLTAAEILKWETENAIANEDGTTYSGGMSETIKAITKTGEIGKIVEHFEKILSMAYGELSEDGEYFQKTPELFEKFKNHAAYSDFFMYLLADNGRKGADFINSLLPPDLAEQAKKISDQPDPDRRPQAPADRRIKIENDFREQSSTEQAEFEAWKRAQGQSNAG